MEDNAAEVWRLLEQPNTYFYLAGLTKTVASLEKAMNSIAGSTDTWQRKKKQLMFMEQWAELLYE